MEDRSSFIPSFARGLNILLVDHDTTSLMCLSSMLEQYTFQVTTTDLSSIALSMVQEQKDRFKLVMANANMPDMDILEFLHVLFDKGIPVILMSSETSLSAAKRAIAEGASFILHNPMSIDDLRYVWQHAYTNKRIPTDQTRNGIYQENEINDGNISQNPCKQVEVEGNVALIETNCTKELEKSTSIEYSMSNSSEKQGVEKLKRINEDRDEIQRQKKVKILFEEENDTWKKTILEEETTEKHSSDTTRSRVIWTPDLHLKFTAAISALGDKKARPKPILEMMNVPHLTQRQVASHLQKYKSQVRRICETGTTNLPAVCRSSSFYGRTRILDSPDKNISAPSKSCDFGIQDILRMSKSFYGFGNPNSTSGNASASNSTEDNPNLGFMDASVNSGTESCIADKFPTDVDSIVISNSKSGNVLDTDMSSVNDMNEELDVMTFLNPDDQELPILDKNLTGSGDFNREMDATAVSEPIHVNQTQTQSKYTDLWNMLEEEPDGGFNGLAREANPDDIDRYCEWLADVMLGADPDGFSI